MEIPPPTPLQPLPLPHTQGVEEEELAGGQGLGGEADKDVVSRSLVHDFTNAVKAGDVATGWPPSLSGCASMCPTYRGELNHPGRAASAGKRLQHPFSTFLGV